MTELVSFANEIQYSIVLREGFELMLAGLIMGLLIRLAIGRLIGILLYSIHPVNPISIIITTMILIGAASLLASYFPARHVAKIDPMEALMYE